MWKFSLILAVSLVFLMSCGETTSETYSETMVVEASCGMCHFGMESPTGCKLAVKLNDGTSYWVKGIGIHDHGDSHSEHGFCSAVRKAEVAGKVENGKFVASSFKLLPVEKH